MELAVSHGAVSSLLEAPDGTLSTSWARHKEIPVPGLRCRSPDLDSEAELSPASSPARASSLTAGPSLIPQVTSSHSRASLSGR